MRLRFVALSSCFLAVALSAGAQQPTPERVRAIAPPATPLPAEQDSRGVTRFSFIVYGDTRGRRDGLEVQYEHSLVVDSMLARIKQLAVTPYPVRFVLQSGDAVVNGRDPRQWNVSFTPLIDRLTKDGNVPYFLAPGNHDVTSAPAADSPERQIGLRNYFDAVSALIPRDGARRLSGQPAYAFGYGNTFVVSLDSNIAGDDKQFQWIKGQLDGLDRARYVNVIAFFHHAAVLLRSARRGAIVEAPAAALRATYMPLFRAHHVRAIFSGHEHLFEHWVERYVDASGPHRMDLIVTGGGGAPLYTYQGEPDLREYLKAGEANKVALEHLVKPGIERGGSPYHFVVVRVDGDSLDLEVVGVDWGVGFQPYRSNRVELKDPGR